MRSDRNVASGRSLTMRGALRHLQTDTGPRRSSSACSQALQKKNRSAALQLAHGAALPQCCLHGMCVDKCVDMGAGSCVDMCTDTRAGMWMDIRVDLCVCTCVCVCVWRCVWTCVLTCARACCPTPNNTAPRFLNVECTARAYARALWGREAPSSLPSLCTRASACLNACLNGCKHVYTRVQHTRRA